MTMHAALSGRITSATSVVARPLAVPRRRSPNSYTLTLSDSELRRYRLMAERARLHEYDAWRSAGFVPGARVADVGCGPAMVLVELAKLVGPDGHIVGVERDADARAAAREVIAAAGVRNADIVEGDADATGLTPGSYDAVMMRHVLLHNGPRVRDIVAHLASLLRPGGALYLAETDATALRQIPEDPDLEDQRSRFLSLLVSLGNDLAIGPKLGQLIVDAGLELVDRGARYDVSPIDGSIGHGLGAQARPAMQKAELATPADFARWDAASARYLERLGDKVVFAPIFRAVGRRPLAH